MVGLVSSFFLSLSVDNPIRSVTLAPLSLYLRNDAFFGYSNRNRMGTADTYMEDCQCHTILNDRKRGRRSTNANEDPFLI